MKTPLFFPDSEYLADKWWHRLAIVIFWSWLLLATGVMIGSHVAIYLEWNKIHPEMFPILPVYLVSLFLPSVVYRAILFVCTGSKWKGTRA